MPLSVKDGMGAWIDDFAKSDAPQFKGKNKEERRDMAIAAYLTAKRGPEKEEKVRVEAQTAKQKADMDRAMAAFKKRGGKVKKVAPGRAQGAHGKDDLGTGMMGMLNKGDTSRFKTRKKVRSMESTVYEAVDPKMRKVKQLGNLGLVGKSDVNKLMQAMKSMDAGKEVPKQQRKIIFDAFGSLIDLVTGDTAVFQKAKKSVKEEVQLDEINLYRVSSGRMQGNVHAKDEKEAEKIARSKGMKGKIKITNRGKYKGQPRLTDDVNEVMNIDFGTPESTKAYKKATPGQNEAREVDTKAMSAYTKYAKAKKVDDDSVRMAFDNPNHPESKRMMKDKSFATALKMYKASIK